MVRLIVYLRRKDMVTMKFKEVKKKIEELDGLYVIFVDGLKKPQYYSTDKAMVLDYLYGYEDCKMKMEIFTDSHAYDIIEIRVKA